MTGPRDSEPAGDDAPGGLPQALRVAGAAALVLAAVAQVLRLADGQDGALWWDVLTAVSAAGFLLLAHAQWRQVRGRPRAR